jgi:alanine racemase
MAHRAVALIDAAAFRSNIVALDAASADAALMVVVKADAYGHGMVPMARIARELSVPWLGVALLSEARTLREAGDIGRILAWLWAPDDPDLAACVAAEVDISVSSLTALEAVLDAAAATGVMPRVHLKIDTGLSRNGAMPSEWDDLVQRAAAESRSGRLRVEGVWSHLANADQPTDPAAHASVLAQADVFAEALAAVHAAGLEPPWIHLANSAAVLWFPELHFTLVRCGIATYGVSAGDGPAGAVDLQPVMTLRAQLAHVKVIPPGQSVSYGSLWTATEPTRVGLVAAGYADGIPRISMGAQVDLNGHRCDVLGRIAMDQFVIAVPDDAQIGDWVTIFGSGGPSADDWAETAGSIGYEMVTRIGARVPREVV